MKQGRPFDENSIIDKLQAEAIRSRRPLSCTLELSYRCNFRCPMCYVRMTDEQAARFGRLRTVDEWISMAKQLRDAGVLELTLTGGESTLYPGFERLYRDVYKMGFKILVMSNAAAWTDSVRELFRELPPQSVAISLYGGSNETYEKVTGDPKGLDNVIENIKYLQSLGIPVRLNYTAIKLNVMDFPKVIKLCSGLGLSFTKITYISPHARDRSFTDYEVLRLSPAQRVCIDFYSLENIETALEKAAELEKEPISFVQPKPSDAKPLMNVCMGSLTGCAILWNGDMNSCLGLAGDKCYKPFEVGFEAAWAEMQADHDRRFLASPVCAGCELFSECEDNCRAKNIQATGSSMTPDPDVCRYTWLMKKYRETYASINESNVPSLDC